MPGHARLLILIFTCLAFAGLAADARVSRRDADLLKQKIETMKGEKAQRTTVTEQEVNSYLAYESAGQLPAGVVDPSMMILGPGRISGRAVVDLDRVRKTKTRGWLDPAAYLTGRVPITVTGVLTTKNGVGQFRLESASAGGLPVPRSFVQYVLNYYASSTRLAGVNIEDPFTLPARIQEVLMRRGQATVVQ